MKIGLNKTWKLCLEFWKWAADQPEHSGVSRLKTQWFKNNGYDIDDVEAGCFFCEYATSHDGSGGLHGYDCVKCPGNMVYKTFNCMDSKCNYSDIKKFYKKLVRMNRKRLKKEGKL